MPTIRKYLSKLDMYNKVYFGIIISCVFAFFIGMITSSVLTLFWACFIFQLGSISYSLMTGPTHMLYIGYQLLFFLFLMSRYFVTIILGYSEGYGGLFDSGFSPKIVFITFIMYGISLFFSELSYRGFELIRIYKFDNIQKKIKIFFKNQPLLKKFNSFLDFIDKSIAAPNKHKIFFVFCVGGLLISGMTKIHYYLSFAEYAKTVGYSQSYLQGLPNYPQWLYLISRSFEIFFFTTIAFRPRLSVYLSLSFLYLMIASLELESGRRMQLMQSFLIILIFFFICYWKKISKKHKKSLLVLLVILIPILIIALQLVSNNRYNLNVKSTPLSSLLQFFYNQGVSTRVVGLSYELSNSLPQRRFYSLGPIMDLFTYLSGNSIPIRSSIDSALNGHVFSDALSYLSSPANYFHGISLGSSYIAELFVDFGFAGIMVGSFIYGILFRLIERILLSQHIILIVPSLLIARELIIAPRSQYLKFLFGVSPTNLILFVGILIIGILLSVILERRGQKQST